MNGTGTQKTIKMMKHYHRNISRSERQLWSSHDYFQKEFRKLDPKPGECFALFRSKDNLRGFILVEKLVPGWTRVLCECKAIIIARKGFERATFSFDDNDLEYYSDIIQIEPHRFHVLDKQIAMMNVQLNSYKLDLEKQLANPLNP